MSEEHILTNVIVPLSFPYNNHVGYYLDRYISGLGEKKILAITCPSCKRVYLPPRQVCGRCNADMSDWVEVGNEGTVENFTVAKVSIDKGEVKDSNEPYIVAQVKLNGADSLLTVRINADSGSMKKGMRVKPVFKDEPKGTVGDLEHFEPI